MIDPPGSSYWKDWDNYVRTALLKRGLISPADLSLYRIVATSAEAVAEVSQFYRNFHSIRYIDGKLVVRIAHPPSKFLVERLNNEFSDIVVKGRIEPCEPHRYELEEPQVAELFRLKLHFDQKHLGRLRLMIDVLNDAVTPAQAATSPTIKPVHWITPEPDRNGDAEHDD